MDIEQKIDLYLDKDDIDYDGIDESWVTDALKKGTKGSFKGIAWLIENSFDLLSKEVANSLERSAAQTSMDKIGKVKNNAKQLKQLEKKAAFYKENFIRIIYRIEELNNQ